MTGSFKLLCKNNNFMKTISAIFAVFGIDINWKLLKNVVIFKKKKKKNFYEFRIFQLPRFGKCKDF